MCRFLNHFVKSTLRHYARAGVSPFCADSYHERDGHLSNHVRDVVVCNGFPSRAAWWQPFAARSVLLSFNKLRESV
jgi:hypothetical protein